MMQSRSLYSNCRGAQFEHELMLGSIIGVLACRRKNKPEGSTLVRKCWCKDCPRTCPVHVVGKLVEKCVPGEALFGGVCLCILQSCLLLESLFEGITAHEALEKLRFMLAAIGVEKAELYRSHDIRRGHALDLQCAGGDCVL